MKVLAFETSCDETSVAIVGDEFRVYSNVTRTHVEHSKYGGVVPELASRAHMRLLLPLTEIAMEEAGVTLEEVELIAVTKGPGLLGALLVGLVFAKTLAQVTGKPFLGINHLEGHIFSIFLGERKPELPLLFLIVSGGHTELVWMPDFFVYKCLGGTLDDAAGEAFDKVAKILGLPYPGGPEIEREARKGDREFFRFPRAKVKGYDFSFSGIKTAVLYYCREKDKEFVQKNLPSIAASFQEAMVDMLLEKTLMAVDTMKAKRVAVVGGVSNNGRLRDRFREEFGDAVYFPPRRFTVDNAAMIGAAALMRYKRGERSNFLLKAEPSLPL